MPNASNELTSSCLKVVVSVMNDESDPVIVDAGLTVPQVAAVLKLVVARSLNNGDEVNSGIWCICSRILDALTGDC